ncbi:peptidoglycan DD-metalloendopeptidase family protein, partial [Commensalibacter sp. Nvir]|uniref:murein hydrolase activator EnvC family protein n=1 Tax=Commensalibacter sp. Nvir TaxID=3069817 RepID=UPI0030C7F0D3
MVYASSKQTTHSDSLIIPKTLFSQKQKTLHELSVLQDKKTQALKHLQIDQQLAAHLNQNLLNASNALFLTEKKVASYKQQLIEIDTKCLVLDHELNAQSQQFSKFLPLIERLSLYPTDTLIAASNNSPSPLIGLMFVKQIANLLEKKAKEIKAVQEQLYALRKEQNQKFIALNQLQSTLSLQKKNLSIVAKKAKLTQQHSSNYVFKISQNVAKMAKKAKTINDAIKTIIQSKRKVEQKLQAQANLAIQHQDQEKISLYKEKINAITYANTAEGLKISSEKNIELVNGPIVSLWGSKTDSGPAQGITYAPPSQASVRSPCSGQVEFAGSFRGFGHMIILNCGKDYRFVLAGMGLLTVGTGQTAQKGIIIGRMPVWSGNQDTGR